MLFEVRRHRRPFQRGSPKPAYVVGAWASGTRTVERMIVRARREIANHRPCGSRRLAGTSRAEGGAVDRCQQVQLGRSPQETCVGGDQNVGGGALAFGGDPIDQRRGLSTEDLDRMPVSSVNA